MGLRIISCRFPRLTLKHLHLLFGIIPGFSGGNRNVMQLTARGICTFHFLSAVVHTATGLSLIVDTEPTCFIIEQPEDTAFVDYEFTESATTTAALVTLTDSLTQLQTFNKEVTQSKGQLTMAISSDQHHSLCISDLKGHQPFMFSLTVQLGHPDSHYRELAAKEKMDRLQLEAVRLNDQIAQILSESDFIKVREMDFHDSTEAMERNAQWWPILQIFILLVTGVFQVKHLKTFFQERKLV